MKMKSWMMAAGATCISLVALLAGLTGCEVGSADSVINEVDLNFSGYYDAKTDSGVPFVNPANSGALVTSFILRQNGSQLEAIDNNNQVFRGSINNFDELNSIASFVLEGATTIGRNVTISGTLTGEGTSGIMEGTWVEPNMYARIYGDAVINPQTNQPSTEVKVTSDKSSLANSEQANLTATGGSGSYSWQASGFGTLSTSNGSSAVFTCNSSSSGSATITATDTADSNKKGSVTITINGGSSSLAISPASASILDGGNKEFKAMGGSGGYTWSVSDVNKGKVDNPSGNPVTYSRMQTGTNILTVTDSSNNKASATISQP